MRGDTQLQIHMHTHAQMCWKDKETIPYSFDDAAESVIAKLLANNMLHTRPGALLLTHFVSKYVLWLWLWLFAFSDSRDGPLTISSHLISSPQSSYPLSSSCFLPFSLHSLSPPVLPFLDFWLGRNNICPVSHWPFGKLLYPPFLLPSISLCLYPFTLLLLLCISSPFVE